MTPKYVGYVRPFIVSWAVLFLLPCLVYFGTAFKYDDVASPMMIVAVPFLSFWLSLFTVGLLIAPPFRVIEQLSAKNTYWRWLGVIFPIFGGVSGPIFISEGLVQSEAIRTMIGIGYVSLGAITFAFNRYSKMGRPASENANLKQPRVAPFETYIKPLIVAGIVQLVFCLVQIWTRADNFFPLFSIVLPSLTETVLILGFGTLIPMRLIENICGNLPNWPWIGAALSIGLGCVWELFLDPASYQHSTLVRLASGAIYIGGGAVTLAFMLQRDRFNKTRLEKQ